MKKIPLLLVFLCCHIYLSAQSDCDQPLKYKDKIVINNSGNSTQDIHNWIVSKNGQEFMSSNGWDANAKFMYDGIPVGLGGGESNSDYSKIVQGINSGNKALFGSDFKEYIYKEILNPISYEKWIDCIKSNNQTKIELAKIESNSKTKGLIGEITDETEDSFILKLKWVASVGVYTVKIRKPIVLGATYNQEAIDFDQEIGSEFVSIPFYKEPGKNISITINTTINGQGSYSAKIEPSFNTRKNSFSYNNVKFYCFPLRQKDKYLTLVAEFKGRLNLLFKYDKIYSFKDLEKVELEGSYEGAFINVLALNYNTFAEDEFGNRFGSPDDAPLSWSK
jgi:hypothetical protein